MRCISLRKVITQLRPFIIIGKLFWFPFAITLLLTIVATILSAIAPFVFGMIIDAIPQAQSKTGGTSFNQTLILVLLYLSIQMISSGLKACADYTSASQSEKISHYLRLNLAKMIFHNGEYHEQFFKNDRGKILSFFSRDIEALWDLFGFAIIDLFSSTIMIVVLCAIVFSVNPVLGLILITISVLFAFAFYWNGYLVRNYFANAAPRFDQMIGFINSALGAYETIVSFRAQQWTSQTIGHASNDVTRLANKAHLRSTSFSFVTSCVNLFGLLIVWMVCLPGLLGQSSTYIDITLGQFVAVIAYFSMVMRPLENISGSAKAISKGMVSMERLSPFFNQSPASSIPANTVLTDTQIRSDSPQFLLQVDGLEYTGYCKVNQPIKILNNISFNIHRGEMVGLAGASGSGKSTLLRLLARLAQPTNGSILAYGTNFQDILEDEFRTYVRYIPQEAAIFPVDIRQNLALENQNKNDDNTTLQNAVELAAVPDFLKRFDDEFDIAAVGLSGGEAQRLSLARAFFNPTPIMLIDEPTSALDLTNSMYVSQSLQTAARDGAVIVASHDKHILEKCTRVFVLENGYIIESGLHTELHRNSEIYRSIISSAGM